MVKSFGRKEKRRQRLEARKDWLSELNRILDWEIFRPCLDQLPSQERKGILEYCIVDPIQQKVSVLTLVEGFYDEIAI